MAVKQVHRLHEVIFLGKKETRNMVEIDFFGILYYFEPWRQTTVIYGM
jgi:hypothetical protein